MAFGLGRERRADLRVEFDDQVGGVLRLGHECRRRERRHAGLLRVGVAESGIETGAAQHDEQPVLTLVPEEDLHAWHVHRVLEPLDDGLRLGVGDAPGAPVGDRAVGRQRGEVAAGGDVAGLELEVEAGGRQRAATELELLGVVAEQAEVAGARPGRDARPDGLEEAGAAVGGEPVEIGGDGLLELGAVLGVGVAAEAVHHDEEDLGVGGLDEVGQVHALHANQGAERVRSDAVSTPMPEAIFHLDGDIAVPTEISRGPWSPNAQHGGAPSALLAGILERMDAGPPAFTVRLTIDLMRPVPLSPLRIERRVVRPGKKLQIVEASLYDGDIEVARATALRLRLLDPDHQLEPAWSAPDVAPLPPPGDASQFRFPRMESGELGFWNAVEMSAVEGQLFVPGPAVVWFHLRVPVVAGEETLAAAAGGGGGRLRQRRGVRHRPHAPHVHQRRSQRHPAPPAGGRVGRPRRGDVPGADGDRRGRDRLARRAGPHRAGSADRDPGGADGARARPRHREVERDGTRLSDGRSWAACRGSPCCAGSAACACWSSCSCPRSLLVQTVQASGRRTGAFPRALVAKGRR